jgi:hypothetical protein
MPDRPAAAARGDENRPRPEQSNIIAGGPLLSNGKWRPSQADAVRVARLAGRPAAR